MDILISNLCEIQGCGNIYTKYINNTKFCDLHASKSVCQVESCTRKPRKKGICVLHLTKRICVQEGCYKAGVRNGYCYTHLPKKGCNVEGCNKFVYTDNRCYSHKVKKICTVEGCTTYSLKKGVCYKHRRLSKCIISGCIKEQYKYNKCYIHLLKLNCDYPECFNKYNSSIEVHPELLSKYKFKNSQKLNLCYNHYNEYKKNFCKNVNCEKIITTGKFCSIHLPKCKVNDCNKNLFKKNLCKKHFEKNKCIIKKCKNYSYKDSKKCRKHMGYHCISCGIELKNKKKNNIFCRIHDVEMTSWVNDYFENNN